MPLVEGALGNYSTSGFNALTGPISRGDISTVAVHLEAMKENNHDSGLYRSLGRETIRAMTQEHMGTQNINEKIDRVLRVVEA